MSRLSDGTTSTHQQAAGDGVADAKGSGPALVVRLETGLGQPEAIALYEAGGYHRIRNCGSYASSELSVCFAEGPASPIAVARPSLAGTSLGGRRPVRPCCAAGRP
jgi:hypothetical protein